MNGSRYYVKQVFCFLGKPGCGSSDEFTSAGLSKLISAPAAGSPTSAPAAGSLEWVFRVADVLPVQPPVKLAMEVLPPLLSPVSKLAVVEEVSPSRLVKVLVTVVRRPVLLLRSRLLSRKTWLWVPRRVHVGRPQQADQCSC
jgi:hypothetical protein